jgi:hypothetical protein
MNWTEQQIKYIIQDFTEENVLACRALFMITDIEFTTKITTMAVTLSKNPVLKINLEFCNNHLQSENDVKAVLLHEFLHVLLLHTLKYKTSNTLLNIALDAIINAIIFRYKGMQYAAFFARFYPWEKISFLLRPGCDNPWRGFYSDWIDIHRKIYNGKYCADDLYELLVYLSEKIATNTFDEIILLGNHTDEEEEISNELKEVLDGIMQKMDGTMIWNKSKLRGIGRKLNVEELQVARYKKNRWAQSTIALLKKSLLPDNKLKTDTEIHEMMLPVMSSSDRRAIARFKHSGMIPMSINKSTKPAFSQLATIYLDVSGSMSEEIDELISLLYHFRTYIKMPLLVFSNEVVPARFKDGKLEYESTGGTSIGPVFNHLRQNNIKKSLIVSDGYVEKIDDFMLRNLRRENINVLVSANGNPQKFMEMKIPYLQLEKL